ncbi:LppA family lipoprotein [Mycobacterium deserti]|uniref:LppA family lipoprotein n=1 Tax=Mycobacterium deserti TaxID=2978347 RepID=A0ABT2MDZ7_9MYCO|nr:LppA family lipoprotein [Mycobacterium deserti]MCT7660497.1 LppA family lipoprotein [Mycobacterium deserti]
MSLWSRWVQNSWQQDEGLELPTWVQWIAGGFVVLAGALYLGIGIYTDQQQLDPEELTAIAALEDTLRPRGAVEDAVGHYETVMQQIADELSVQQPGLTWRWERRTSRFGCEGEFEDTSAVHMRTRHLVADEPIPGDKWAAAHQVVRDRASSLGVGYVSGLKVSDGAGGAIDLTQGDVAVLSGVTPCQLKREELDSAG